MLLPSEEYVDIKLIHIECHEPQDLRYNRLFLRINILGQF